MPKRDETEFMSEAERLEYKYLKRKANYEKREGIVGRKPRGGKHWIKYIRACDKCKAPIKLIRHYKEPAPGPKWLCDDCAKKWEQILANREETMRKVRTKWKRARYVPLKKEAQSTYRRTCRGCGLKVKLKQPAKMTPPPEDYYCLDCRIKLAHSQKADVPVRKVPSDVTGEAKFKKSGMPTYSEFWY